MPKPTKKEPAKYTKTGLKSLVREIWSLYKQDSEHQSLAEGYEQLAAYEYEQSVALNRKMRSYQRNINAHIEALGLSHEDVKIPDI
jgi:hypothetical protein